MSNQPRVAKVLAALLVSMTVGATVLMALGNNPPSAGAFCLSSYYRLDSVEQAIMSTAAQAPSRWNCIEIYYSDTRGGDIEQIAALNGLSSAKDINCHFVVCNGVGGKDGQIQQSEKWRRQWSVIPGKKWYGTDQTIRICIIADADTNPATNYQVKRTQSMIEALCRKFHIQPESIYYPGDWK